jgi:uncharacterized integral membrane protein
MNVSRAIAAIALLVVTMAVVAFAVMNPGERVVVNLGFRTFYDVPMILALFVAFLIGVALTLLYCLYYFIDLGLNVRRLKKRNRDLETELVAIRNLPIEEALGEMKPVEDVEGKEVVS